MFRKEWVGEFRGHRISIENAWGMGVTMHGPLPLPSFPSAIKLYIDGECVDTTSDAFGSRRRPLLRGRIEHDGRAHVVEAFVWSGAMSSKARLVVDGQTVDIVTR